MEDTPKLAYPNSEHPELHRINMLLDDWNDHLCSMPEGYFGGFNGIVRDGFYPHYFSQKVRILFVGKEALGLDACDYLEVLAHCYRVKKEVGKQHLNRYKFHARMLRIAHGILHDRVDWSEIPLASSIGDTFASPEGISFAFMNLSKISNESEHWAADWATINSANDASTNNRNFPKEQIEILSPDVIITMNIMDQIRLVLAEPELLHSTGEAEGYVIDIAGKPTLLINTWHFSARKSQVRHYYAPICEILDHWEQWRSDKSAEG